MVSKKEYQGTVYWKLRPHPFEGLVESLLKAKVEYFKNELGLNFIVILELFYKSAYGGDEFSVFKTRSKYLLQIENGTTEDELFNIVLEAYDYFLSAPDISEDDKKKLLYGIAPPLIETVKDVLKKIADDYD